MLAAVAVAEDVRMTPFHLVADRGGDVLEPEQPGFLRHPAVEDHLQQQIAEFVLKVRHVAALDRVGDFIGLLDRIGSDRRKILRAIPFTPGNRIAQSRHDRDEPFDLAGSCVVGAGRERIRHQAGSA